jgi:hypothetical protein
MLPPTLQKMEPLDETTSDGLAMKAIFSLRPTSEEAPSREWWKFRRGFSRMGVVKTTISTPRSGGNRSGEKENPLCLRLVFENPKLFQFYRHHQPSLNWAA